MEEKKNKSGKLNKTKEILIFLINLYEKQENIKIEYQILNVMEEK